MFTRERSHPTHLETAFQIAIISAHVGLARPAQRSEADGRTSQKLESLGQLQRRAHQHRSVLPSTH